MANWGFALKIEQQNATIIILFVSLGIVGRYVFVEYSPYVLESLSNYDFRNIFLYKFVSCIHLYLYLKSLSY